MPVRLTFHIFLLLGSSRSCFCHLLVAAECVLKRRATQGTIPYLGDLEFLANILLDANQLTGTLPAWAGNLSNLTNLWLDSNNLTGSIPQVGSSTICINMYLQAFCINSRVHCKVK